MLTYQSLMNQMNLSATHGACVSLRVAGIALLSLGMICAVLAIPPAHASSRTIEWEDLIPEGWNPNAVYDALTDEEFKALTDEQFFELQSQAQSMLDQAPTVDTFNGETIRIPGFLLPLDFEDTQITEFLLVPYFGACVHTPPPPANQIIHGILDHQFTMNALFEPVWVSGKLEVLRSQSTLGEAGVTQTLDINTGYTMQVELVEPYTEQD